MMLLLGPFVFWCIFVGGAFFGFVIGALLHRKLAKEALINWEKAAGIWRAEAEKEKERADLTKQWADATLQNVADAAAAHGLQFALDDMPIPPRAEALEAKEWPDLIGEK